MFSLAKCKQTYENRHEQNISSHKTNAHTIPGMQTQKAMGKKGVICKLYV